MRHLAAELRLQLAPQGDSVRGLAVWVENEAVQRILDFSPSLNISTQLGLNDTLDNGVNVCL